MAARCVAAGLLIGLLCGLPVSAIPAARAGAQPAGHPAPTTVHLTECIARQLSGDDPTRLFSDPARFDCRHPAHTWGPGDYWVRYGLPDGARLTGAGAGQRPPDLQQLRFVPQWQRNLAVITRDAGGRIVTRRFNDAGLSQYVGIGGAVNIPLEGHDRPVTDILVRVDGALNASGLVGDPQVQDAAGRRNAELIAVAVIAAFGGLGFGLFCYNLVLWLTIRERFQLTYCLSLLAMLAYVWANAGVMAVQFPGTPHGVRLGTSYVMLGFVAALAMQFITDFIEADRIPPRLRYAARYYGATCVLTGIAVAVAPAEWRYALDRIYALAFVPLPVLVVAVGITAWRRGSRAVRVLAIAWAFPLCMAVLRIAHAMNLVHYGLMVQYSLIAAMSIEALLSSLAMSFRIKRLTDERDRAVADEQTARHLANIDSLTGLLNRRALLAQVIAWQSHEPLRLLLVDIDRFKSVNDNYGHLIGDEVLRGVAEVLAIRADLSASVARLGGEEFALIGTTGELSEAVALAILADVRARPMAGDVLVTVSVGMAEGMVHSEDDWRELYRRADAALYQAKSEGRNRAVHAPPLPASSLLAATLSAPSSQPLRA